MNEGNQSICHLSVDNAARNYIWNDLAFIDNIAHLDIC